MINVNFSRRALNFILMKHSELLSPILSKYLIQLHGVLGFWGFGVLGLGFRV